MVLVYKVVTVGTRSLPGNNSPFPKRSTMALKVYEVRLSFEGKDMDYPMWKEVIIHAVVICEDEDAAVGNVVPSEYADEEPIHQKVVCIAVKASSTEDRVVLRSYQFAGFTGKE